VSQNRYYSSPALSTTLSGSVSATASTVGISASPASLDWPAQFPYTVLLDWGTASAEAVQVNSVTSSTTLNVTRGIDGTAPVAHSVQTYNNVFHGYTAQDVGETQAHMSAVGPTSYNSGASIAVTAPVGTATGNSALVSIPTDTVNVHGIQSGSFVVGGTDTQTLTNKNLTSTTNSFTAATTSQAGVIQIDGTAADILMPGIQAAGANGKAADSGHVHPFPSSSAAPGAITATTQQLLITLPILPANLAVGSTFNIKIYGTYTNTTASTTNTFAVLAGTLGSLSDTTIGSAAVTSSATTAGSTACFFDLSIRITTSGSSGAARLDGMCFCGIAGTSPVNYFTGSTISPQSGYANSLTTNAWNTTTSTFLDFAFQQSHANTFTVNQITMAQVK
jgi:hypothetical protein